MSLSPNSITFIQSLRQVVGRKKVWDLLEHITDRKKVCLSHLHNRDKSGKSATSFRLFSSLTCLQLVADKSQKLVLSRFWATEVYWNMDIIGSEYCWDVRRIACVVRATRCRGRILFASLVYSQYWCESCVLGQLGSWRPLGVRQCSLGRPKRNRPMLRWAES